MTKVFGFDLGIASIGWAAVDIAETETDGVGFGGSKILGAGVRCFTTATNAADRRMVRGMRRRLRHRAFRLRQIRALLRASGLIDIPEPKKNGHNNFYLNHDTDINIWRLRAVDAFERKLTPRETGRILYHLAKHRGYDDVTYPIKNNKVKNADAKDTKEAQENLKATKSISENFVKLQRAGGTQTMCQVIYATNPIKMRNGKSVEGESTYVNSIPRSEIMRESRMILCAQKSFGNDYSCAFDKWYELAFYQRAFNDSASPLYRSIDSMRGRCKFTNLPVAPKDAPSAQIFAMLSKCMQNKFSPEQIDIILAGLYKNKTGLKYSNLRKLLNLDDDFRFLTLDYSRKYDKNLKMWVEPKVADVEKASFGHLSGYHALRSYTADIRIMDKVYEILATKKTPKDIAVAVSKILPDHAESISTMTSSGFMDLALEALYKINPLMQSGKRFDEACTSLGWDYQTSGASFVDMSASVEDGMLRQINWSVLGKRLTSPVARRTLAQLRRVYNAMVHRYGVPDRVHLEIGRELKKSPDEIARLKRENDKNRLANEAAYQEHGKNASKYKLYMEQQCQCPYCGSSIDENNWDAYEIDHILPFSRSLDNSQSNKVLVCQSCNQAKGNKTPYEFLSSGAFYDMTVRARGYHNMAKLRKLTNTDLPASCDERNEFIARNANDNATIARFAKQYLLDGINTAEKVPVMVRTGALTDYLRHQWGLSKNRDASDKHHAQDAIVIACATQGMVRYLSTLSAKFENKYRLINEHGQAWYNSLKKCIQSPWPNFRDDVMAVLDTIIVSRPPRCNATGAAHNDTIYPNPRSYRSKRGKNSGVYKGKMPIRFGNVERGDMFRFDLWRTALGKYVCMPIFVADTVSHDETKFLVPDAEFICTLHKDDYVKIKTRKGEEYEGYITQMDHGTNLILYRQDNKSIQLVKKSVGMCADIRKCVVTTLGGIKTVKLPEKRMPVANKK